MTISKLSADNNDIGLEFVKNLNSIYKKAATDDAEDFLTDLTYDFENDGKIDSDADLASKATNMLDKVCEMLEGTKYDTACDKIIEAINEIGNLADTYDVREEGQEEEIEFEEEI